MTFKRKLRLKETPNKKLSITTAQRFGNYNGPQLPVIFLKKSQGKSVEIFREVPEIIGTLRTRVVTSPMVSLP